MKYKLQISSPPIQTFLQAVFRTTVFLLNADIDGYLHHIKRLIDKNRYVFAMNRFLLFALFYCSISFCLYGSDILPSDRIHYLSLCNFLNRFVWFCQLYSDRSFICLQSSSSENDDEQSLIVCFIMFIITFLCLF